MKKFLTLSIILLSVNHLVLAQEMTADSTAVKKRNRSSKNIGLGFGTSYSILSLQSSPFVMVDSTGQLGESKVKNGFGINVSLCYNFKLGSRLQLRPGVEAHVMKASILYDAPLNLKQRAEIFPVAIEIPITLLWNFQLSSTRSDGTPNSIKALVGIRPVIPHQQFKSLHPATKDYNLNIDAGIGMPCTVAKFNFNIEAIFSYGLLNLIGENDADFHTTSVSHIGRSYAGLRFYFN